MELKYDNTLAEILARVIAKKYGNVKKMSDETGIPYMTISTVLKKGVENSLVRTVNQICEKLDIDVEELYFLQRNDTLGRMLINLHGDVMNSNFLKALENYGAIPVNYESTYNQEIELRGGGVPYGYILIAVVGTIIDSYATINHYDENELGEWYKKIPCD